ncbi:MAG: hypothetical protein KDC95_10705 [Planctomycetes bacterium]|nr:hypothetical protein [Planctomycetota bacterium]
MNASPLALVYLWKEYRAQRTLLLAYFALVWPSLMLVFLAHRETSTEGNGGVVLAAFVAVGMLPAIFFVPSWLTGFELTAARGDLFVRRLPGMLAPAFGGKLLFLSLTSIGLPLLSLALGELFVWIAGIECNDLWRIEYDGAARWRYLGYTLWALAAIGLAPWVWAASLWMSRGRFAAPAAGLLCAALFGAAFALLRLAPGLDRSIASWHWLWFVWPTGLLVAYVSLVIGRRGGSAARSACCGLTTTALLATPLFAWLGMTVWGYHHPDPYALRDLHVVSTSEDGRHILAFGAGDKEWDCVPVLIDLENHRCRRLASTRSWTGPDVLSPAGLRNRKRARYWLVEDRSTTQLVDLETAEVTTLAPDEIATQGARPERQDLPQRLRERLEQARRLESQLRVPGFPRSWIVDATLFLEDEEGTVHTHSMPHSCSLVIARGHGALLIGPDKKKHLFDLIRRTLVTIPCAHDDQPVRGFAVQSHWLHRHEKRGSFYSFDSRTNTCTPCGFEGEIVGLFGDDAVLVKKKTFTKVHETRLMTYDVIRGELSNVLELPASRFVVHSMAPSNADEVRLTIFDPKEQVQRRVLVNTTTREVTELPSVPRWTFFVDDVRALATSEDRASIVEIDLRTRVQRVVYPMPGGPNGAR